MCGTLAASSSIFPVQFRAVWCRSKPRLTSLLWEYCRSGNCREGCKNATLQCQSLHNLIGANFSFLAILQWQSYMQLKQIGGKGGLISTRPSPRPSHRRLKGQENELEVSYPQQPTNFLVHTLQFRADWKTSKSDMLSEQLRDAKITKYYETHQSQKSWTFRADH